MQLEPIPKSRLEQLPVFPLPATVLFPGTVLPLHIFEERYLAMVKDALASDKCIGIVMARDGDAADAMASNNAYAGIDADVHDVACGGRIVHTETLDDGRMNILVHGVERVRLVEELPPASHPYRRFRASSIPNPTPDVLEQAAPELARLQSSVLSLRSSVAKTDKQLVAVLGATSDPLELADILCAVLVGDPPMRQKLLASVDLRARLQAIIDTVADAMVRVGEPPRKARMN